MNSIKYDSSTGWNIILLLVRIWLGYRLAGASYSSVIDIIFHPKERAFFEKWFGEELHFPMPLKIIGLRLEQFNPMNSFLNLFLRRLYKSLRPVNSRRSSAIIKVNIAEPIIAHIIGKGFP